MDGRAFGGWVAVVESTGTGGSSPGSTAMTQVAKEAEKEARLCVKTRRTMKYWLLVRGTSVKSTGVLPTTAFPHQKRKKG